MKILLTGANGQLGRHLRFGLAPVGKVVTTARSRQDLSVDHPCDLADVDSLEAMLDQVSPDVIVNAAAWTDVDGAERNPAGALVLNRDVPTGLADWCKRHDRFLLHFSTDYVFDGRSETPLNEDAPVGPINQYGQSKRAGEVAILESACRSVILRTSWVYSALPGNFLTAIFNRARQGQPLRVVDDQIGNPTWAGTLARAAARAVSMAPGRPPVSGLFHVSCRGPMSWQGFARLALDQACRRGLLEQSVPLEAISSDEWPQVARRPAWSVLDPSRFEQEMEFPMPDVPAALDQCLATWGEYGC